MASSSQPPSTAAQIPDMLHTQNKQNPLAIYHGRPQNLTGPAIHVFHPVFSHFQDLLHTNVDAFTFEQDDLAVIDTYMGCMANSYPDERSRQTDTEPVFNHFFGATAAVSSEHRSNGRKYTLNGYMPAKLLKLCSPVKRGRTAGKTFFCGKNAVGIDAVDQGLISYRFHCEDQDLAKLLQNSHVPAFLLAENPPNFVVYGMIYHQGHVVAQPLTEWISVFPLAGMFETARSNKFAGDEYHIAKIARCFRSLARCVKSLETYYEQLEALALDPHLLRPSPHFSAFSTDAENYTLSYHQQLAVDSRSLQRLLFHATATSSAGSSKDCVVKYSKTYSANAHRAMAELGFAPPLLYCARERTVGQYFVIIMEYIMPSTTDRLEPGHYEALKKALEEFHKQGYVFGDLREPNILFPQAGGPMLVDFDWSGKSGDVRYPLSLNEAIEWPPGAKAMRPIYPEHDRWMLERLFEHSEDAK
ncbi:hypothetical protein B0H16DRAFT_1633916 [Mycena metata]|uniref:Aminoglycoside phosphotransferase domain-containing protein n=1 Tax=Mycena metata TaxID=1033252 RepID=A0AAD7GWZ0_9AGAR|nr:hypothetical protein B0H16DRAFT_1633916 [Mycena metata]